MNRLLPLVVFSFLTHACLSTGQSPNSLSDAETIDPPLSTSATSIVSDACQAIVTAQAANVAAQVPPPLTDPNKAASSPNKITIGATPPGVSTGLEPNLPASPNSIGTTAPVTGSSNQTTSPIPTPKAYTAVPWPNIGFDDYVGPLGSKVVALTFDDGPDGTGTGQNNTAGVLDFLKANNLKATFFVCGNVWTNLATDAVAQEDLKRIVAEGHDIGSHTYTHPHLDTITATQVDQQFSTNLSVVQQVLGSTFKFDKIRAPFGFPFQTNNPNVPLVSAAAAKYGVHIGWGIDTDDWKCASNAQSSNCIMNNLKAALDAGHSGPILMHAVYQLTVQTLPEIVSLLRQYNYGFVTVEQMVAAKYGASSKQIIKKNIAAKFSNAQISSAAVSECSKNQIIQVLY